MCKLWGLAGLAAFSSAQNVHGHMGYFWLHNISNCHEALLAHCIDVLRQPQGHLGLGTLIPLLRWPCFEICAINQLGTLREKIIRSPGWCLTNAWNILRLTMMLVLAAFFDLHPTPQRSESFPAESGRRYAPSRPQGSFGRLPIIWIHNMMVKNEIPTGAPAMWPVMVAQRKESFRSWQACKSNTWKLTHQKIQKANTGPGQGSPSQMPVLRKEHWIHSPWSWTSLHGCFGTMFDDVISHKINLTIVDTIRHRCPHIHTANKKQPWGTIPQSEEVCEQRCAPVI